MWKRENKVKLYINIFKYFLRIFVELQHSSRLIQKAEISSDESRYEDSITDFNHSDRQLHTPSPSHINKKPATFKIHSTTSSSSISRKPTIISTSTPISRTRTPSPEQSIIIPFTKEDDSYFEEEEDDELKRLSDDSEQEESQSTVQKLRREKYFPGTEFRVTHNLKGLQIGDLTIYKDEILILIEQKSDDWWLFKNPQTQQQGLVPINHIQRLQHRIKPTKSSLTLVDVFKINNYIPSGFIASDLALLTQDNRYKLSRTLIPKISKSNFAFSDLHWRFDKDQIYIQQSEYQKIFTIKKCLKIPKIKDEHVCHNPSFLFLKTFFI